MGRRRIIHGVVACTWLCGFVLAGCSPEMREKLRTTFLDSSDKPPVPTRRVRRDLLQEIADLKRRLTSAQAAGSAEGSSSEEAQRPIERVKTWEEAVALLPKDSDDNVDWVKAIKDGVIAPRSGPSRTSPQQALISLDVMLVPEGDDGFRSPFSHQVHTELLACSSCHPAPFQMKAGADTISMDQINSGESCGVCHGTVAFSAALCARCHPAMAEG
jgi:c(7)-type cytochrome triheme protein